MVFPPRAHPRPSAWQMAQAGSFGLPGLRSQRLGLRPPEEEEIEGKILESREPQQGSKE